MFTGIVQAKAQVVSIEPLPSGGTRLKLLNPFDLLERPVQIGESIAVDGCCLTAVQTGPSLSFDLSSETLQRTTISSMTPSQMVNLERAPSIEDGFRFGGHYVTGHVDDVATVLDLREEGGSWKLIVGLIQSGDRYLFDKGSIAVDGVSLTVNQPSGGQFWAAIVPHTYEHTCISEYRPGRRVNLEYDAVAKYVVETVQRLRR